MTEKVTDEMLMAFVDGELDADAADDVRRAMAADPSLERRADSFRTSRELAREAFGKVIAETVPERLVTSVMARGSGEGASASRPGKFRTAVPIAAAVALAAGLGGYLLGQIGTPGDTQILGGPVLAQAVGDTLSGEQRSIRVDGQEVSVSVLATYAVEGGLCRTFEATPAVSDAVRGVGCRFGETWHIEVAVAMPDTTGFAPAGAGGVASLDAYLDALGAEGPLGPDEEARRQ